MSNPHQVTILKSGLSHQGGLEKYTWRIARAFAEKNCKVTLLTSGSLEKQALSGHFEIVTYEPSSILSYRKVIEFNRFCAEHLSQSSADIVFGMDRNSFQTHLRAGNGVHAAYLEKRKKNEGFFKRKTFALNPLHRNLLKIEKESFENPGLKVLITNSHMVKDEVLQHYSVNPQKIHVVHNGVEWLEMQADFSKWPEEKKKAAKDLNLDPNTYQFLFVGHNYRRKGLQELLEALSLIKNENFHLSIVGKEKKIEQFKMLAAKLGLSEKVTFFGSCKNIRQFYQVADCLVIPSYYDPFANVTVEALAMGLFVISSKTNGGHEVLTSENGTVIENLSDRCSFSESLKLALKRPKTSESSQKIRSSVSHLDFSNQLLHLTDLCFS